MALSFAEFFGAHQTQLDTWLNSINGQSAATTLAFNTLATDGTGGGGTGGGTVTTLPVGSVTPVTATAAAETFALDVVSALGNAAASDTQIAITGFAVAADSLRFDVATANAAITTLNQLHGVDLGGGNVVAVQTNVITGNTLINFGLDAGGQAVSVELVGLLDPTAVEISLV